MRGVAAGYVDHARLVYEGARRRKDAVDAVQPEGQDRPEPDRDAERWRRSVAAACGCPCPAVVAAGSASARSWSIILFVVLTQCTGLDVLGGGGSSARPTPPREHLQDRGGREQVRGVRGRPVHQLGAELLVEGLSRPDRQAYEVVKTVRFQGSTDSGCGQASADMGPFYCPNDRMVYLDTTFFDDMLTGPARRRGRSVRDRLRDRARVRPPRRGPARHPRQDPHHSAGRRATPCASS